MRSLKKLNKMTMEKRLQHFIEMEKLCLQANKALGNAEKCDRIKHKIIDAKIYLLGLRGFLPK